MRRVRVRRGTYKGEYPYFESVEEFKNHFPEEEYLIWAEDEPSKFKPNKWVEVDDGYIIPIMNVTTLRHKKKDLIVLKVRFPTFSTMISIYKGKPKFYKAVAGYTAIDIRHINNNNYNNNYNTINNILRDTKDKNEKITKFYILVFTNTISISQAVKLAGFNVKNNYHAKLLGMRLLMEKKQLTKFISNSDFLEKIQNDPDFSDDAMISYVKEFMANVKKGSKEHLASIPLLLELLGKTSKAKKLEEVPYEEVPPPMIENSK